VCSEAKKEPLNHLRVQSGGRKIAEKSEKGLKSEKG
jgi:hypothetical protein